MNRIAMNRMEKIVVLVFCCLLLSACGAKSDKWIMWGVDVKTEIGMRPNPVESFFQCVQQNRAMSVVELKKEFDRQATIVGKNRLDANWGPLACLAFHESATVRQIKTTLSLFPEKEISHEEQEMLSLLRVLLGRRVTILDQLGSLEEELGEKSNELEKLQKQVDRLEAIEGQLER